MKHYLLNAGRALAAVAAVALLAMLPSEGGLAQVVTQLPEFISPTTVFDFGNGPLELKLVGGNALLFTSQGSAVGSTSGSSTNLTLTATPTTAPCIGCIISGTSITSGTTVSSFNGTTTIGLSAAMTVAAGTAVAFGAACPATVGSIPVAPLQASVGGDFPFYTQARVCGGSPNGPGAQVLSFAIGAH